MRPSSRGFSDSQAPPGTGARPGSGKRPPGTASRLNTGMMARGTVAAVGVSLNASVNVSDRPLTGQGVMGMRAQSSQGQGRVIQDTSYYVGLIRKKINEVNGETIRLKSEFDQLSKDKSQLSQLERKYESLLKNKDSLEGQLADYNLALDKTRSSTDPEDVQEEAARIAEKNRQSGHELDRILSSRKQREAETANVEMQIEAYYRSIQGRINELEPGKLRAYNDLLAKQRDMQERASASEARLNDINSRIRQYESDDKANSVRKQYVALEKTHQNLRKDVEGVQAELAIANLDPKEAHSSFVTRVKDFKRSAEEAESRIVFLKSDIESAKRLMEELSSNVEEDSGELAKYELLQKRDQDMTTFMDKFDSSKASMVEEMSAARDTVVALLEHMALSIAETGVSGEEEGKSLNERNLKTVERTIDGLQAEKRKREKELDTLAQSEPKLRHELTELRADMKRMAREIDVFSDVNGMRKEFERTQQQLQDQKKAYGKRRDAMRQQIQALSVEHEGAKKALAGHDVARELDDTEKRLRHYERAIFEIKEFVETKTRESDYEGIKGDCLKKLDSLNALVVKASQGGPKSMYLK